MGIKTFPMILAKSSAFSSFLIFFIIFTSFGPGRYKKKIATNKPPTPLQTDTEWG
jgi:hypothetical protein